MYRNVNEMVRFYMHYESKQIMVTWRFLKLQNVMNEMDIKKKHYYFSHIMEW
jgi:hypothetical protein